MAVDNLFEGETYIPIADFYAGKSVFITGGTGYLGKVFIEKLLYSCPLIKRIYILIRDKKGLTAAERILHDIIDKPLFTRLKKERPEDLNKIVPVIGDITCPDLRISIEDRETLINEVSVVIHSAASVKFNEPLSFALKVNFEGTRNVLELSRQMKNIKAFVYISTAYSNTDKQIIDEMVYPPPIELAEINELLKRYGDDERKTIELLNGRPNTYTFVKALAEFLVAEYRGHVPAVIIRPSIVTPSIREPEEGWVDNWFGSTALITALSKGICRAILGDANNVIDFIPLDYVCNLTLVSAARRTRSKAVAVYNSCTSSCNPITIRKVATLFCKESIRHEFYDLPHPSVFFTNRKWIITLLAWFLLMMAYVADFFRRIRGKEVRYVRIQSQANVACALSEYFTSRSWVMRCERVRTLSDTLCARDRLQFPCDPASIDWTKYIPIYLMGIRKYLMNTK